MARRSSAARCVSMLLLLLSGAHAFLQPAALLSVAPNRPAFVGMVCRRTPVESAGSVAGSGVQCSLALAGNRGDAASDLSSAIESGDSTTMKMPRTHPWTSSAAESAAPIVASTLALWASVASAALASAASDEAVELAELPPPYIPAIFAVVLLGGVGWFTASLGNVMDEEASLGLQSGAKAKKDMERSRSSYFKKK
jgi:hypothetical protein